MRTEPAEEESGWSGSDPVAGRSGRRSRAGEGQGVAGRQVGCGVVNSRDEEDPYCRENKPREREDWQKRGIGGRVSAMDPAAGTITVATNGTNGNKNVTVHVSKSTIVRRYAPDSVKFDDATLATVDEIKADDQLRARGDRSGSDLNAEEIVAGTFRNIAGTVVSTDAAKNELTVMNLATKKSVTVKIRSDSQLHKLPPMMAQGMAMRLKGSGPGASAPHSAEAGHAPAMANGRRAGERKWTSAISIRCWAGFRL